MPLTLTPAMILPFKLNIHLYRLVLSVFLPIKCGHGCLPKWFLYGQQVARRLWISEVSTDRINNFKKLMYALVIDSIAKFMQALHAQRSRLPGRVAVEESVSDAGGQNLLKFILKWINELMCWQHAAGVRSHTVTRFFSGAYFAAHRVFSLKDVYGGGQEEIWLQLLPLQPFG